MHFLSHYYVDRHRDNAYFVLGALLPDISPGFTRTYNQEIRKSEWKPDGDLGSIHCGVLRHYDVDAWFHRSLHFQQACRDALQFLIDSGLDRDRYRLSFLAHITVEMMIDRQLIGQNTGLVNEYYHLLKSIQIDKLSTYLSEIMADYQRERTITAFRKFVEISFLQYFDNVDGVAEGLVRTADRVLGVKFADIDRQKLVDALHNIDNEIRYSWNKLLEIK